MKAVSQSVVLHDKQPLPPKTAFVSALRIYSGYEIWKSVCRSFGLRFVCDI